MRLDLKKYIEYQTATALSLDSKHNKIMVSMSDGLTYELGI